MRVKAVVMLLAAVAMLLAAAPAEDQAGSSEAENVKRSCSAKANKKFDPPSGKNSRDCYDANNNFVPTNKYDAVHYTNDVDCGSDHQLVPGTEAAGVYVSGNTNGSSGFLQACSDGDLPIQGRATLEGDPAAQEGTLSIDGDKDNQPEQMQGWAQVDLGNQSVRCGDSDGRLDSNNATSDDTQEDCG